MEIFSLIKTVGRNMEPDIELRLSAQRALWGKITLGLRAVSVEIADQTIRWRCIFESEIIKEKYWEELSCAASEVVADFSNVSIDEEYVVIPNPLEMEHLKWLVFLRYGN